MQRIQIKDTDLSLCPIGFGTANAGIAWEHEDAFKILDLYVNLGGNVIDTARIYNDWVEGEIGRSERVIGDWIKHRGKHDDLVIITKGGHPNLHDMTKSRLSKEEMQSDLEKSLNALRIPCIDIYFYHRDDTNRPVSELIETMECFVREGKIKYYGCSNWTTKRMKEAVAYCQEKGYRGFVANQALYNIASKHMNPYPNETLTIFDEDMLKFHKESNILAMPYFSLCSGFFTKLENQVDVTKSPYYTEKNLELAKHLKTLTEKYNATLTQVIMGFFFTQDIPMCALAGASTQVQLLDFMKTLNQSFSSEDFK
ncbi:MAG: aldo/keto reductase [Turicibacter sp.]|nr:aldo/keto reductase [Turicibacter sp.]